MIFPESMVRLTIVGPKSILEKTIKELYSLKVMHIVDHTKGEIDIGLPLQKADELSGLLVTVRALKDKLGFQDKDESNGFTAVGVKNFKELASTIKNADEEIHAKEAHISSIGDELRQIAFKESLLNQLSGIKIPLEAYKPYKSLACFVGIVSSIRGLDEKIFSITDKADLSISITSSNKNVIALFIYKEEAQKAWAVLSAYGFLELDLSSLDGMTGLPSELLYSMHEKEAAVKKKLSAAKNVLRKSAAKWKDFLVLSEKFLAMELEKAEAPLKFASTKNIFVVTGWIPEKKLDFAKQQLARVGSDKVSIDVHYPEEDEAVPALLDNPKQAKPFEFFLRLYDMPKHSEIDPTSVMIITFPILFGFILGDIGYGIVLLAILLLMKKKLSGMGDLVPIMTISAVSSIIFGVIFGEFFGAEELFGYNLPRLVNRVENMMTLLYVAVGVGFLQLNLGFILGFINVYRTHGLKHAMFEKGSWMLLELGVIIYLLPKLGINFIPSFIAYVILLASVVMLWMGESVRGIMEIPGLFGNLLSYSRLMAVGVASVQLALVINSMAGGLFAQGGFFIFMAVMVLLLGHGINILLGILGGFLHSTRLHYVEFFGKFFKGGGIPYRPFGEK